MSGVSEAFIEAAWRGQPDPLVQLVELRSDALEEPIRSSDCADPLLPGRRAGIVSGGVEWPHFPFQLTWSGARRESPFGEGRLTIANVDRRIEEACDAAEAPPEIDLLLVRRADPDVAEKVMTGARIPAVEGDAMKATAIVRPRDFSQEPACARNYTPASTPGMF
jgi:hypothetical protein